MKFGLAQLTPSSIEITISFYILCTLHRIPTTIHLFDFFYNVKQYRDQNSWGFFMVDLTILEGQICFRQDLGNGLGRWLLVLVHSCSDMGDVTSHLDIR